MPLTREQLDHLERRLREERERVLRRIQDFTDTEAERDGDEPAGELSKFPQHPADLGTDTQNEELEATLATRRTGELAEIDAALERLARSPDTFGMDEETGEPIAFERLDIIPYARTSVRGE
jgi:DnaK suppressor protein